MVIDYTNTFILIVMIAFFGFMDLYGFVKKKAWTAMASTIVSIALLVIHLLFAKTMDKSVLKFNVYIDFITLAINIPLLVIIDEIETRRHVIKSVFENKYKSKK